MKNKFLNIMSIPIVELLGKGLAFITIILMTHILPIYDMGNYSIIITLVMIASVFMDGGINNKIYSSILQGEEKKLSQYYVQKIIFSFISILLVALYAYMYYDYWIEILFYITMTFFVSQIILFKFIYRANQNKIWDIVSILIDPIFKLSIILIIYLLDINISLQNLILLFLIASIIEYLIIEKKFHTHYPEINYKTPKLYSLFKILNEVKYFILFYFLYILYQRIDIFYIEKCLNTQQTAIYFSAYNIYTASIIFVTALVSASFPQIKHFSLKKQILFFKKYFIIYFALLFLSYYILPIIYPIIYPLPYRNGAYVLFWLLCAIPFVFMTYLIIFNFNFLKYESKNILPIVIVLMLKIFIFSFFIESFNDIVIFAKSYILFEIFLSIIFLFRINISFSKEIKHA